MATTTEPKTHEVKATEAKQQDQPKEVDQPDNSSAEPLKYKVNTQKKKRYGFAIYEHNIRCLIFFKT